LRIPEENISNTNRNEYRYELRNNVIITK